MLRDHIEEALTAVGLAPAEAAVDALVVHAGMMLAANAVQNLTRITDERGIAFLHVADSLTALPFLTRAPDGAFVDLGSGAGYPGIPLALLSGRHALLVEARSKKATFLEQVIAAIGIEAEVSGLRAEEVAGVRPAEFAAVTARALAPLPSLVELAAPLLAPRGLLIALKGEPSAEELAAGEKAAALVGLVPDVRESFVLPTLGVRRTIVCYRRQGEPRIALPRRPGMAQRKPLA